MGKEECALLLSDPWKNLKNLDLSTIVLTKQMCKLASFAVGLCRKELDTLKVYLSISQISIGTVAKFS